MASTTRTARWLVVISYVLLAGIASADNVTLSANLDRVLARSAAGYVGANFDWHLNTEQFPVWVNMSAMVLDLSNPALRSAAAALAPGHLRLGGSEGDKIVYNVDDRGCANWKSPSAGFSLDPHFCLNMSRWSQLVAFAQEVRAVFL